MGYFEPDLTPMPTPALQGIPDQNTAARRYARQRALAAFASALGGGVQAGDPFGNFGRALGAGTGAGFQLGQVQHQQEQEQIKAQGEAAQRAEAQRRWEASFGQDQQKINEDIRHNQATEAAKPPPQERQPTELGLFLQNPKAYKAFKDAGRAPDAPDYVPNVDDNTLNAMADAAAAGMPSPIRSNRKEGIDLNLRILRRAIERHPDMNLAGATADYRALSGSLSSLQRGVQASEGFSNTSALAMKTLDNTLNKIPEGGSTPANWLLRGFGRNTGNESLSEFDNARQVVNTELGRLLGQGFLSNGTQLTDDMRHEIRQGMGPNATRGQIRAALRILEIDRQNKLQAGASQVEKIRGQIGNISGGKPAANASDPLGLFK